MELLNMYASELGIFIAGAVSTRKAFFSAAFKVFTVFFFLERVYNLVNAFKTIGFRQFIKKIFFMIISLVVIIIIFISILSIFTGCSSNSKYVSARQSLPLLMETNSSFLTVKHIANIEDQHFNRQQKELNKSVTYKDHNTLKLFKALKNFTLEIRNKKKQQVLRKHVIIKSKKLEVNDRSNFAKSLEIKACKGLLHSMVEANKQFSNGCKLYYKNILHYASQKISKKKFFNISSNRCERLGTSFIFRWKVKIHTLKERWPNIKNWGSEKILLSAEGDIYREVFKKTTIKLHTYILKLSSKYKECKELEISNYNNNKIFGLLPKRKLNEE